jgi:hypothetical protein
LERLKVQLETQRVQLEVQKGQMEADRKEREQRNHELMLKILETTRHEALGRYQGPTLPELIGSVKDLRALSGDVSTASGLKEILSVLREASSLLVNEDASDWKSVLAAAVAPILPHIVPTKSLATPSGQPTQVPPLAEPGAAAQESASSTSSLPTMPTAYDQVVAQIGSLFQRVQSQASAGLDCGFVLDNLIALEEQGDPVANLVLNSFEKSETFQAWLIWLRSMIGSDAVIEQQTLTFLSNLFTAAKALPKESEAV